MVANIDGAGDIGDVSRKVRQDSLSPMSRSETMIKSIFPSRRRVSSPRRQRRNQRSLSMQSLENRKVLAGLMGTVDSDLLIGTDGDDVIRGHLGEDVLVGRGGNDVIRGQAGDDLLVGGDGDDTLRGGGGDDVLFGGLGVDTLRSGGGNDTIVFSGEPFAGADVSAPDRQIIGGEDDVVDFNPRKDRYRFNTTDFDVAGDIQFVAVDANQADQLEGNVIVLLNADDDDNEDTPFLAGTAANQIADLVDDAGAGFFVYFNSNLQLNRLVYSTDLSDASADLQILSRDTSATGSDAIRDLGRLSEANFEFVATQDGLDRDFERMLIGNNGRNLLRGANTNDIIIARGGRDLVLANDGDDLVQGGRGDDLLFGQAGDDTLEGGYGNDRISGGSGDDLLVGGVGNDVLNGGTGSNTLDGGSGDDLLISRLGGTLSGGSGADQFLYTVAPFADVDVTEAGRQIVGGEDFIDDFDVDADQFVINRSITRFATPGDLSFFNGPAAELPSEGVNVIVLQDADNDNDPETPFLAGTAANLIAENYDESRAGFFVYFNSNLGLNRLVYSTDLSDATADLQIVARLTDRVGQSAIDTLPTFREENFRFVGIDPGYVGTFIAVDTSGVQPIDTLAAIDLDDYLTEIRGNRNEDSDAALTTFIHAFVTTRRSQVRFELADALGLRAGKSIELAELDAVFASIR